jgi:hypothetical protein
VRGQRIASGLASVRRELGVARGWLAEARGVRAGGLSGGWHFRVVVLRLDVGRGHSERA